jgi:hypothetical protein
VEAGPLVAQRRRDDHDVAEGERVDQRPRAAAGDERGDAEAAISSTKPAASGAPTPGWITETGRRRCELVDRIATDLAAQDVLGFETPSPASCSSSSLKKHSTATGATSCCVSCSMCASRTPGSSRSSS